MVIAVESDADLPTVLNSPTKQAKKAKQLAQAYTGVVAKKARGPTMQGFFSRTMIVSLENNGELVVQFRPEPLDMEPFMTARQRLGPVVPDIGVLEDDELKSNGMHAYWMTRVPGRKWADGARGRGYDTIIAINKTLGQIFSQGHLQEESGGTVDKMIRPHLVLIAASETPAIKRFRDVALELIGKLDSIKHLPLFISHFDLNEVNIMPLPFGAGFSRIHTLAGQFTRGEFHMPDRFEEAERGFWQELFDGALSSVRKVLDANLNAVQTAVLVGTLLEAFQLDEGSLGPFNPVTVKALPKFLSYRIPSLRGSAPPYDN